SAATAIPHQRQRVRHTSSATNRKTRNAYPPCSEGIAAYGFLSLTTLNPRAPVSGATNAAPAPVIRATGGITPRMLAAHAGAAGKIAKVSAPAIDSVSIVAAKR